MSKLFIEKITEEDSLSIEEQNRLINDLLFFEAIVLAHQEYLKIIGKVEEAKKFIQNFVNNLSNEKFIEKMENRGKKN